MISFFPYRVLYFSTKKSLVECKATILQITERPAKWDVDLTKLLAFECTLSENSFIMSKGSSSLTFGKMSGTPVLIGQMKPNEFGGTDFKTVVRINKEGTLILTTVGILLFLSIKAIHNKLGFANSVPVIGLMLLTYGSMIIEFNKTIRAFVEMLKTSLAIDFADI